MKRARPGRPIPRAVGVFVALAVGMFAIQTALEGGVLTPNSPLKPSQSMNAVIHHLAGKQDLNELVRRAHDDNRPDYERLARRFFMEVDSHFYLHRSLASGREPVERGYSASLKEFREREEPLLAPQAKLETDGVEIKTALFSHGKDYEFLAASNRAYEEVFWDIVKRALEQGWLATEITVDTRDGRAMMVARWQRAELTLAVVDEKVFPGTPTTVFYNVKGEGLTW